MPAAATDSPAPRLGWGAPVEKFQLSSSPAGPANSSGSPNRGFPAATFCGGVQPATEAAGELITATATTSTTIAARSGSRRHRSLSYAATPSRMVGHSAVWALCGCSQEQLALLVASGID